VREQERDRGREQAGEARAFINFFDAKPSVVGRHRLFLPSPFFYFLFLLGLSGVRLDLISLQVALSIVPINGVLFFFYFLFIPGVCCVF